MQLITKDISITGKHADIINKFNDLSLYPDKVSVWVQGVLTGLYYGKKSDPDNSSLTVVQPSFRTYFRSRGELENLLLVLLQHEEKYQGRPLSTSEIFLIASDTHDINKMIKDLELYALYGLEVMEDEYKSIINETNNEIIIGDLINRKYENSDSIDFLVKEDSSIFYKTELEPSIAAIFGEAGEIYNE